MDERAAMDPKQANTSEAGWALITEGTTAARLEAHRLRKLLTQAENLIKRSDHREHLYQLAGDLIMSVPQALGRLERALDRTSYALAKIGEDHLKDRLPISDRALVEDGVTQAKPFPSHRPRTSVERVVRKWQARRSSGEHEV